MSIIQMPQQYQSENNPVDYDRLTHYQKERLSGWIDTYLKPYKTQKTQLHYPNSYELKHCFQFNGGFYVSNGAFKGAMLEKGYKVHDRTFLNWTFNVGLNAVKKNDFHR